MEAGKNYLVAIYDDEDILKEGVKNVRGNGVHIHECYTPFPVHGLEDVLGYRKTRLGVVAFMFAMTGTILALTMQTLMITVDWPMQIGGKPYFPFPDFVPITFELSILLAAFGMAGTFLVISDLKPYKLYPRMFDIRSTDDKHVMAVDIDMNEKSEADIKKVLEASGASEVNKKTFE